MTTSKEVEVYRHGREVDGAVLAEARSDGDDEGQKGSVQEGKQLQPSMSEEQDHRRKP